MEYKYTVDVERDYGSMQTIKTYRFVSFSDAFRCFVDKVNNLKDYRTILWNITLYDIDLSDVRAIVSEADFID